MGTVSARISRVVALLFLISCPAPALPARAAADDGPYRLRLERGDSLDVVRLEPAAFGMFRYVRTDSVEGYLSWHKVVALTDARGEDLTRDVMERRRAIGVDPLLYRSDGSSRLRRRHASRREDRTFPIFEAGYYAQAGGPRGPHDGDNWMASAEVGALRNLSRSMAVGAVLRLEADYDRTGIGVGLRGRRWLNNTFSVDGGAGWMFAGDDDRGEFKGGAFFGEAAINFADHVQVGVSVESWRYARHDYVFGYPYGYLLPETPSYSYVIRSSPVRETRLYVGAKTGRYPGILLVTVVMFIALAAQPTVVY